MFVAKLICSLHLSLSKNATEMLCAHKVLQLMFPALYCFCFVKLEVLLADLHLVFARAL